MQNKQTNFCLFLNLHEKMSKTRFLPTTYPNFANKSCGEIICQTETSFIIICKLCDVKIFEYDEFIKHFQNTHWPEIFCGKPQRETFPEVKDKCDLLKNDLNNVIEFEKKTYDADVKSENHSEAIVFIEDEQNKLNVDGNEDEEVANSENENKNFIESEDSSEPLAILKKDPKASDCNNDKRFECVQCKRKFTTKFYLRFHIRQQHEPKKFQCDKCSKSFVEKRYLTLHQRSHTGYKCHVCNKVFDKYEALRYHGESHIESRNFICDYENCGKAFPNNRRLSAHKRSHFAQPLFVCEICGSRQRSKEFLVVHIRSHTGEKPYACNQCDHRFASKHFLQDHQAVHATERSHICTVCGKSFASSKSLYHHRHLHSDVKKYVCKICNSAYSQAAGLSAHMRKHRQDSGLIESDQLVGFQKIFSAI